MTPAHPAHAVEPRTGERVVRAVIWLPGLAVALAAAVATAHGLFEVAVAAGVPVGIAWLYPLITDGLALVAYAATARLHAGAARYAWSVVVLAAGLSGLAQAAYLAGGATLHASPALRFGVGAWPAVAAAVVAHLLYLLADIPEPSAAAPVDTAAAINPQRDVRRQPPTAPGPVPVAVQPTVQPALNSPLNTPDPVQPDLYNPAPQESADDQPSVTDPARTAVDDDPVEHPAQPDEPPLNDVAEPAPRERARTAAVRYAARHSALPTVTELEALAGVSRGTAAAALKALRQHPHPAAPGPRQPRTEDSAMNPINPIPDTRSTDQTNRPNTTSTTTTTTQRYSERTNATSEPRTTATRSKDSHRCITIRGWGPASGRPERAAPRVIAAVDLCKIVSVAGGRRGAEDHPRLQPGVPVEGGRDRPGELLHRRRRRRGAAGPVVGRRRGEARPHGPGRRAGHARGVRAVPRPAARGVHRPGTLGRGVHPRTHRTPVPVRGRVVRRGG